MIVSDKKEEKEEDKTIKKYIGECGVVLGMEKINGKEKIYYVDSDTHLLCIGATRSGKSRHLVVPSICSLALSGESIVCTDPKGELNQYTAPFLKKLGYDVITIDFKSTSKSHRYNLLQPVINAIKNNEIDRATNLAWDITNALVDDNGQGERIWTNGEMSIIASSIMCTVFDNIKRPEYQNLTNVYWFIAEMGKPIGNKIPLADYMRRLPDNHPAKSIISISDIAPSKTRGSFYTSALATLKLFTTTSMYGITCNTDFELGQIGEKKQALFIILPDDKTVFYPIATLMITQLYETLAQQADKRGGRLKQRVNLLLDEFGNFAKISDFTAKLTVGGGRGIRFNLFIQAFAQLEEKYSKEVSETIKGNCQTWVYLQADDNQTLNEISEKLGTYTTSTYQLSSSQQKFSTPSNSHSISLTERKLLTLSEVKSIKRPYQLVLSREKPVMMYSPDLSQWKFNKMLGLGDQEHNRKVREERENKRPINIDLNKEIQLWRIWVYYQREIIRQLQANAVK